MKYIHYNNTTVVCLPHHTHTSTHTHARCYASRRRTSQPPWIKQSIHPSINQSINLPIYQSINQPAISHQPSISHPVRTGSSLGRRVIYKPPPPPPPTTFPPHHTSHPQATRTRSPTNSRQLLVGSGFGSVPIHPSPV